MMRILMAALGIAVATVITSGTPSTAIATAPPAAPPTSAPAPAETKYVLTGENTKLTFVGTKEKGKKKHDGGFKKLTGTATVAGTDFTTLKINVDVDCDSLYADDAKLAEHLKNPDFFGVKDNPHATFKSTKVEKSDKIYVITGDLTILGKTKPVTFGASISVAGDVLSLSSEFTIDRTQWGMTYGKGMIDDVVTLKLAITAKK